MNIQEEIARHNQFLKDNGADEIDYILCTLCGRADWKDWGYERSQCPSLKEARERLQSYYSSLVGEEELLTKSDIESCYAEWADNENMTLFQLIANKAAAKVKACILARMKPLSDEFICDSHGHECNQLREAVQAQFSACERAVKGGK